MKEKIPNLITKEVIQEKIEQVASDKNIDIALIERKAIKEVLDEFISIYPEGGAVEDYPMHKLRFWCGKSIEIILDKYPELKFKVDIIKNDVWNELIYYLFSNRFEKVKENIKEKNPGKISPNWISKNNPYFYDFARKFFKDNETKRINWEFVRQKLEISDEKWFQEDQTLISFEAFVDKTIKKLEELNPETFSPIWVIKNVYGKPKNIFKRKSDDVGWEDVVSALPQKWQERWTYQEQKDRNLEECLEELLSKLEELKPETFNPKWIEINLRPVLKKISKIFRDEKGRIDWSNFSNFLPEKWKGKWSYIEQKVRTEAECLEELVAKLEEVRPEVFSPKWIQTNLRQIYERVCDLFRVKEDRINWGSFVSKLPQEWQDKWQFKEEKDRSFDECIEDLLVTLNKNDYSNFSPYWIYKNNRPVHTKLREFLRQQKGEINWQEMLDHLPAKYSKLWREQGGVDYLWYENQDEIDNNLKPYQDKFYTVVYYSGLKEQSDRVVARKIVIELLKLVKNGNKKAQEWLLDNLKFTCTEWSIKHKELHYLEFISSKEFEKIIERCVYRFRGDENSNFFNYIFKSLAKEYYRFAEYRGKTSYQDWKKIENEDF